MKLLFISMLSSEEVENPERKSTSRFNRNRKTTLAVVLAKKEAGINRVDRGRSLSNHRQSNPITLPYLLGAARCGAENWQIAYITMLFRPKGVRSSIDRRGKFPESLETSS